jgi:hypothetical protein
MKNHDFSSAAL